MATSSRRDKQVSLPCPAWVWAMCCDSHIAKDRSWFGPDYTSINSSIRDPFGNTINVIGIGTVDLPTKISLNKTGPRSHGTLRLENVLHVPNFLCNIIGSCIDDEYVISTFDGSITTRVGSRPVAFFKPRTEWNPRYEVRLSGPPVGPKVGPSPFDPSKNYFIHFFWPQNERERVAALRAAGKSGLATNESLTPSEKEWLKTHYGGEFKFLQTMGLNIYKDEQREEGRAILRVLMSDDQDSTPSDDETGGFLPDMLAYRQATLGFMKF